MSDYNMNNRAPAEMASALLTEHHGNQRAAEVEAWAQEARYPKDSPQSDYWVSVVRAVVFKGEYPPVARVAPQVHHIPPSL
ncbi:MAG: hypothetical protein ACYC3L_01260 [Gemmatimonadaceae bacterium]